jgi:hypothetical protein
MLLSTRYADPEKDQGEWVEYPVKGRRLEDPPVRFRIRRVPDLKLAELSHRHFGKRHLVRFRKGDQLVEREPEKYRAFGIEKASFALLDSENAELAAGDEAMARRFSEVLGHEVVPGRPFPLDGRWTPELKALVFEDFLQLVGFVNEAADNLGVQLDEEEAGLGKTSRTGSSPPSS